MGIGLSKIMDKVVKDAHLDPQKMRALKIFPNELIAKELGRTLSPLEIEAFGRELQNRGIQMTENEARLQEQLIQTDRLLQELKKIQEQQNSTVKQIIQNIK